LTSYNKPDTLRLLFEVVDAVTEAVGASRLGIRLSPFNK
jgi:2,4-dienoyl-CoA reductase-like NADH-dependent reductase (Old Yellow Enzyme family)